MRTLAYVKAILNRIKHYKVLNIMNTVFIIINSLIQLVFYRMFFNEYQNNNLWSEIIIYVFFAGYLGLIMSIYRVPEFSYKISDGSYSAYCIRPISYVDQFSLIEFGESINNIVIGFPLLLIILLISIYKNISLNILEGILVSFLSMILSIKLTITFYSLTIFTKKNNGPRALFQGIASLLSGSLVPLILWPEKLSRLVKILPFGLIINSPIEVSLGNTSLLNTLVLQLIWIVFFELINKVITERVLCKQEHIGDKMLGIFKRYILLIKNDIKAQLRYPLDFTMQIFIWFIYSFIPIMGLYILFERFGSIGEWGMYHIGYSYGVISFGYDLARMLGRGFDNFHKYTIDGSLDTLLIRPLSLKLQIMGNNFFLRRISGLINYTLILIISIFKLKPSIYFDLPIIMLMTVVLIISVSIFFMGLLLVYASSCIFTVHRNIISDLLVDNLVKVSYLPLNYINKILRFVLLYVIPIGIISYYPIKNILFGNSYSKLALSIFLSLSISNICIFITSKVFDFSLGSYKSTGS